jgi:hypothetical protein
VPLVLAATLSLPALADEANVKKAVEGKLGRPVTSVVKTPYLGLYEVYADGQIFYTDDKVSALLIAGALIDGKSDEERDRGATAEADRHQVLRVATDTRGETGSRRWQTRLCHLRRPELRLLQEAGKGSSRSSTT